MAKKLEQEKNRHITLMLLDGDYVDFASIIDKFGIPAGEFDIKKLSIRLEVGRIYYEGETPEYWFDVTYG